MKRLARLCLRVAAWVAWREFTKALNACPSKLCAWSRASLSEDQDETMFCRKCSKLWVKHWDISFHAETIP